MVKLLNRTATASFLFGNGRLVGLDLVSHEVVRPMGGYPQVEAFRLVVLGHDFYFQGFAPLRLIRRLAQIADRLVRLLAARVVNEAVAFQWVIEGFASGQ